jgi:hypothetical protein
MFTNVLEAMAHALNIYQHFVLCNDSLRFVDIGRYHYQRHLMKYKNIGANLLDKSTQSSMM